ncbi:MAG: hypothetical protein ISR61_04425 [Desulfobacteraceae bacterium]|nr:hypothetical protein [Desulfobacteraceae bacterium]MBL7217409.1 hypothetical protein [Desulfobacteraceae bacterium]
MIDKLDKDFSEELPGLASKLRAIATGLMNTGFLDETIESDQAKGFGLILQDISIDLQTINEALHGKE